MTGVARQLELLYGLLYQQGQHSVVDLPDCLDLGSEGFGQTKC